MLHYFDGRTVPHWQYDFNLNSVLSILSNALKGGVFVAVKAAIGQSKWLNSMKRHPLEDFTLYDNATRGIFGALNFLARIKFMGSVRARHVPTDMTDSDLVLPIYSCYWSFLAH